MTEDENIINFDKTVLYFSEMLYKSFPRCIEIDVYVELKKEMFQRMYKDETDRQVLIAETILWLEENDFLKFETPQERAYRITDNTFFGCVRLTAKGLAILKSPPKSINSTESLGSKISTAMQEKGIAKITELGTDLAIKLATNLI